MRIIKLSKNNSDKNNKENFQILVSMTKRWVPCFAAWLKAIEEFSKQSKTNIASFYADGDGDFRNEFKFSITSRIVEPIEGDDGDVIFGFVEDNEKLSKTLSKLFRQSKKKESIKIVDEIESTDQKAVVFSIDVEMDSVLIPSFVSVLKRMQEMGVGGMSRSVSYQISGKKHVSFSFDREIELAKPWKTTQNEKFFDAG